MELPSKLSEQIANKTRTKMEEHMMIPLDKFTHEDHSIPPLPNNIKQFKIAVTILRAYNGILKDTNKNIRF